MAVTAVNNNLGLDVVQTVSPTSKSSKNMTVNVNVKTQDFGDVLNKTAQSTSNGTSQSTSKSTGTTSDTSKTTDNSTTNGTDNSAKDVKNAKDDVKNDVKSDGKENVSENGDEPQQVDEAIAGEVAAALNQVITDIEETLDVSVEEITDVMESLDLQPTDLLNTDNLTQLVTALAGEESPISLVADESLYTALNDIKDFVNTQVGTLLDNTGLNEEELNDVLQNLPETIVSTDDNGIATIDFVAEKVTEPAVEENVVETVGVLEKSDEPVIIKEDNTKTEVYDELPENQQLSENNDEAVQTEKSGQREENSQEGDTKNLGQQNLTQNLNLNDGINEIVNEAVETAESYTSDSTESIMRQLADVVKIVRNENLTEMELQLHPASLGTVNVSLTTRGGSVTAQFTTQNEQVRAAIEAQASQLRANLEEQGVRVDAVEVSVASHDLERNLDDSNEQQEKQSEQTQEVEGSRRRSINLNDIQDGDGVLEEMQGADDATRIAMEMMAANGNRMDLLA